MKQFNLFFCNLAALKDDFGCGVLHCVGMLSRDGLALGAISAPCLMYGLDSEILSFLFR